MGATPFFIGFLIVTVLLFRFWQGTASHHRVWVGQVDGRKIQLKVEQTTCTLIIDDEVVHQSTLARSFRPVTTSTGIRFRQCFRFDIEETCVQLAGQQIKITSDWTHSQKGDVSLSVGGKRVALIEVVDKREDSLQAMQKSLVGDGPQIQDPRWDSIQKTLRTIRQTLKGEEGKNINTLQNLLFSRFQLLEEMNGKDAEVIWTDEEEREMMIAMLEKDIEQALAVVQQLHQLSIQERQSSVSEDDLQGVLNLLHKLDANQEVEASSNTTKKKLMKKMSERRKI